MPVVTGSGAGLVRSPPEIRGERDHALRRPVGGMPEPPRLVGADMTTLGLIGSGMIGGTLATLAVDAGYQVVLSNSRGPETLQDLAAELGPLCQPATWAEAAEAADLVVVSTPVKAYAGLPAAPFAGKLVMDTGNYYPERDGQLAELDSGALTSSELLARQLPGAEVVKVFNNIFFKHLLSLARPAGAADRSYLPIAGDSAAAKAAVTTFLDSIGYGTVDAGTLADGWRQQPGTPAYGPPYGSFDDEKGTPASAEVIRAALAAATR
jgi:8-hydroxy-5-deazaflavin:NADPH oxidoreductase